MGKQVKSEVQIYKLTEGALLFCSPQGNILFGCPPEVLKHILAAHLPMPDTVVVADKLHHFHSSQASLEFPFYHFLFVQRGLERNRRFYVVGTKKQCKGLEQLLRVTVVGPTAKEMTACGTDAKRAKEIYQETTHLSLKNQKTGKQLEIKEMVSFLPMEDGEQCLLQPVQDNLPEVRLERTGGTSFRVLYGEEAHDIDFSVSREQVPVYKIKQKPMDKSAGRFTLTVLGRSNGFDPQDPANGYLINMDGKLILWDCPAYLHQHLRNLKVDPQEIDALILSHVHEDHIDTSESLRDPPFDLYTTPEVYYSLLVKLAAVFGSTMEQAKSYHKWHRLEVGKPMQICGGRFEFFHSVHAIPALGCRISKEVGGKQGLLHISGDQLSKDSMATMLKDGGISKARYDYVENMLNGKESLVIMDVGGGAIHGDYRDYLDYDGRIGYMHTGLIQDKLPKGKHLVASGEVLNVLG
ncbi:MAG: MBL fold metallo-hydrolase [SAR324 cluster bacterium]|nr:MBL fold metallo-hydrolase [SAR324 cluster bacterium]MCZ6841762.1 MBL fold metallo-hydrolase [SAR324 cluster bacterium]